MKKYFKEWRWPLIFGLWGVSFLSICSALGVFNTNYQMNINVVIFISFVFMGASGVLYIQIPEIKNKINDSNQ